MIKDVILTVKGFNTTISAHFKQEMFLSWATDQNCINHDLFCFQTSEFRHSHSLDQYYNLNQQGVEHTKLANESVRIMSSSSPNFVFSNTLCSATWNMIPSMCLFCLFVFIVAILQLKVAKRQFLEKLSLEPCMDALS